MTDLGGYKFVTHPDLKLDKDSTGNLVRPRYLAASSQSNRPACGG